LIGPPGTGKTLLARAVAGEAAVPFFSISGSDSSRCSSASAQPRSDMFKTAKDNARRCLIDEIDAVARIARAGVGGGSDEREQTLNQNPQRDGRLPAQRIGHRHRRTNRPDVLESGAAQAGPVRPPRHHRPATWQAAWKCFKVHTRHPSRGRRRELESIARKMIGMTGADLRTWQRGGALATRRGQNRIDRRDFERAARPRLDGSQARGSVDRLRQEPHRPTTKRATPWSAGWSRPANPPQKVSIIPAAGRWAVTFTCPRRRLSPGPGLLQGPLGADDGAPPADRRCTASRFAGTKTTQAGDPLARYM